MPILKKCKICNKKFYTKPFFLKKGQGLYCSRPCSYKSMQNGKWFGCYICGTEIYKALEQIKRSKSQKFFCGKSCQTKWRNVEFSGEKHKGWKGGSSIYRSILIKNKVLTICAKCGIKDIRVLAAHHIDKNHQNNSSKNLQWLCHNCHYLAHHGNLRL